MTTITENRTSAEHEHEEPQRERSAALGGFAFVALSLATFLPGAPPASDASAAKIATYFKENAGSIKVTLFLSLLGVAALLWWVGPLWRLISRAEGERPRLAVVATVALGVALTLSIVSGSLTSTAAIRIDSIGEGSQLLYTLSLVVIAAAGVALFVFLGSICVINSRTRILPAWTNYVGGLAALLFLVGGAGIATDANVVNSIALAAFPVWCVWILGVSVEMWRGRA